MGYITIKAFGEIYNLLGKREYFIDTDKALSVDEIFKRLNELNPKFAKLAVIESAGNLLMVKNGCMINFETKVAPGEVLILVTPLSDG